MRKGDERRSGPALEGRRGGGGGAPPQTSWRQWARIPSTRSRRRCKWLQRPAKPGETTAELASTAVQHARPLRHARRAARGLRLGRHGGGGDAVCSHPQTQELDQAARPQPCRSCSCAAVAASGVPLGRTAPHPPAFGCRGRGAPARDLTHALRIMNPVYCRCTPERIHASVDGQAQGGI